MVEWRFIDQRIKNIAKAPIPGAALPPTLSRSYGRGVRLGLHMHREAQLLFAASGVMQVTTPKGLWLVPPARAVWLPPAIEHAVDVLADIEMRALLVSREQLSRHPEAPRLASEFVVSVNALLRETILAAFDEGAHPMRTRMLVNLALFELAPAQDGGTFMPLPTDVRARRIADWLLAHPGNALELDALAATVGASARTITRLFPLETGLTFKEWRQRARIVAALQMLEGGSGAIKRVALRLGYSSVAAFSHAFREVMGTTPTEMAQRFAGRR